jgi:ribonuclease P protein component
MLPKKQRLTKEEIEKVIKEGLKKDTSFFRFKFMESSDFKISPVVSKKVAKLAVDRNKIKRLFFNLLESLDITKKAHIAVFIKKDISKEDKNEALSQLKDFL